MAYEFKDVQELTFELLHGKEFLRTEISHQIIFPKRLPNTLQHIIMFYVSGDRLIELKKHAEYVFGDSNLSTSLSRYITAGSHYMDKSEDVNLVQHLARRKQKLERNIIQLQEDYEALTTTGIFKLLWSRLISKLVPKWRLRK